MTCPVALYPASSKSEKTRFHQINRKTGNRLRQQMVDEETGRVVDKDNKGRGYELAKGKYVEIEPEEIEAVEFESTHTIDIDKFVPEEEIDKRYYERPYYIVPDGKSGEEAFAVIRDAMKDKGRVALAAHRLRQPRAHPCHRALGQGHARHHAALRLRGARREGVLQGHRQPARAEGDGRASRAHILDTKAGHFDPAKFKDEYELALRKLVKRKASGKTIEAPEEKEERSNVIDLMEALRQSVKGKGRKAAALRTSSDSKKTADTARARTQRKRKAA